MLAECRCTVEFWDERERSYPDRSCEYHLNFFSSALSALTYNTVSHSRSNPIIKIFFAAFISLVRWETLIVLMNSLGKLATTQCFCLRLIKFLIFVCSSKLNSDILTICGRSGNKSNWSTKARFLMKNFIDRWSCWRQSVLLPCPQIN